MADKKTNVTIRLNDDTEIKTVITNFEPESLAATLNDNSNTMIALGDVVVHRGTITRVIPLDIK